MKKDISKFLKAQKVASYNASFVIDDLIVDNHLIFGKKVLVGAAHVAKVVETFLKQQSIKELKSIRLNSIFYAQALTIKENSERVLNISLENNLFSSYVIDGTTNKRLVEGKIEFCDKQDYRFKEHVDLKLDESLSSGSDFFYSNQNSYLKPLQTNKKIYKLSETECLVEVDIPYTLSSLHPLVLDSCFTSSLMTTHYVNGNIETEILPWIPFFAQEIIWSGKSFNHYFCKVTIKSQTAELLKVDVVACNESGEPFLLVNDFSIKRVPSEAAILNEKVAQPKASFINSIKGESLVEKIESFILSEVVSATGLNSKSLNLEQNFMDMGVESNVLIQITKNFEKTLQIELYPTLFFEYSNIRELAKYFANEFNDKFAKLLKSSPTEKIETSINAEKLSSVVKHNGDVAIIGMAGVLAESENLDSFWNNLVTQKDLMQEIPLDHFDYRPWFDKDSSVPDKMYSKWGSFISDVDKFDANFFNVSPREAEEMDPQLRHLLQNLYATAEDAGYIKKIRGSNTGVYVGACFHDYSQESDRLTKTVVPHDGTGNASTMLANRPSFFFDLKGPSLSVDTACSSSLVALHLACQALRENECEMAFVSGVNLLLGSWHYRYFCSIGALSPTGRSHSFDERADGYTPGEAIVSILIKPLAQALADGDSIHAVIKGSAINHGGYTPSITAPSLTQESELLLKTWNSIGVDPTTITHIEAHGTGTKLGDPIEINAIKKAFKTHTDKEGFCFVSSAKAHIGHTEGAAGLVGVIKAVLSMQKGILPGMPFYKVLNPFIKLENSAVKMVEANREWTRVDNLPLRAGVSSFGFGGTYAHVVLEEFKQKLEPVASKKGIYTFIFSAKRESSLLENIKLIVNFLCNKPEVDLAGLAYALQFEKEEMDARLGLVASSLSELTEKLNNYLNSGSGFYQGNAKQEEKYIRDSQQPDELVKAWVSGEKIDWKLLWPLKPVRVKLPHYQFEKKRYWNKEESERKISTVTFEWRECSADAGKAARDNFEVVLYGVDGEVSKLLSNFKQPNQSFTQSESRKVVVDLSSYTAQINSYLDLRNSLVELQNVIKLYKNREFIYFYLIDEMNSNPYLLAFADLIGMVSSEFRNLVFKKILISKNSLTDLNTILGQELAKLDDKQMSVKYDERLKRYVPVGIIGALDKSRGSFDFSKGDTVLITGGTRGIGYFLAEMLAKKGVKNLILSGKTAIPSKDKWNEWLNNPQIAIEIKDKISSFKKLESYGVDVTITDVDLTDRAVLFNQLTKFENEIAPIKGVIHAAGFVETEVQSFIHKTCDHLDKVLLPKIVGTDNLVDYFENKRVNYFVLFSSISSVVPNLTASILDYSLGNIYLNYKAKTTKGNIKSIIWSSWKDVGIGEVTSENFLSLGVESHTKDEGFSMFSYVLTIDENKNIFPAIINEKVFDGKKLTTTLVNKKVTPVVKPNSFSSLPSKQKLKAELLDIAAKLLKLPKNELEADDNLSGFGFDSVLITQFVKIINKQFDLSLTPALFFETQTLSAMVEYLLTNHSESFTGEVVQEDTVSAEDIGVAIVGISGRFPGAQNVTQFWQNLKDNKCSITDAESFRKLNGYRAGYISDIDKFDAPFFKISSKEANLMDPQQRVLLQEVWNALEDAGITKKDISGKRVAVYVAAENSDYYNLMMKTSVESSGHAISGNVISILANRISYFFNLTGPSETIDAACASSLVALHRASKSLQHAECDLAIVAGVNAILCSESIENLKSAGMLSPDNLCKTFDEAANGYVRGEGCGVIVLKPLKKATADNDRIYALVKGSAVNHGGHVSSLTVPNPKAQADVINSALKNAKLSADMINYVEAHGTGTSLGDPIEINGLKKVFNNSTTSCMVTAVKTNIGHLEAAAGVAGVIKVLLSLKYKTIPAIVELNKLNPYIDIDNTPIKIVTENLTWVPVAGNKLRAGVSSFGFGGTNAHVILEEYLPTINNWDHEVRKHAFVFSAKKIDTLKQHVSNILAFIEENQQDKSFSLASLAYTLQVGRETMDERVGFVAITVSELIDKLSGYIVDTNKNDNSDLLVAGWVNGNEVDWRELWKNNVPLKISLPNYPFEKRSYWMTDISVKNKLSYVPFWKQTAVTQFDDNSYKNILVVLSERDKSHYITQINSVYPKAKLTYVFKERLPVDNHSVYDGVVYFALSEVTDGYSIETIDEANDNGVLNLLKLIQGFIENGQINKLSFLRVITSNVYKISDEDKINPLYSATIGLAKTLAMEYPHLSVNCLDVSSSDFNKSDFKLDLLKAQISGRLNEAAIRNGKWYERYTTQIDLLETKNSLKLNGVYVIAGGAGGIGFELSCDLAKNYKANLIWLGRRAIDLSLEKKMAKVNSLGGKVTYYSVDIGDPSAVDLVFKKITNQWGSINGVIHAAIVLKDLALNKMDEHSFKTVLDPKIKGVYSLYAATKNQRLDFFALFSAFNSFLGNAGQSNYVAASVFKDTFGHYLKALGVPVKIINWGFWSDVGIVASKAYQEKLEKRGMYGILTQEGIELFKKVIACEADQVIIVNASEKILESIGLVKENKTNVMDNYSALVLLDFFQKLNFFKTVGEQGHLTTLKKSLKLIPKYEQLFEALLDILVRNNCLSLENDVYEVINSKLEIGASLEGHDFKAYQKLIDTCVKSYSAILSGDVLATDIIFPQSSMDLVANIYSGNYLADQYNKLMADQIISKVKEKLNNSVNQKIKILEIGAGTGGTSEQVLTALASYSNEVVYYYTDVSNGFVGFGKRRFEKSFPFVEFKVLDIEKSAHNNSELFGQFDIILGANVIHATKNLISTVSNVKQLLKPQGIFLLNEITKRQDFFTMTFGLLDGWWLFDDEEFRIKHSPLLSKASWKRVLENSSFSNVDVIELNENDGQSIIFSYVDEVVSSVSSHTIQMIEEKLKTIVVTIVQCRETDIDIHTNFSDLGVDSILANALVAKINKEFSLALKTTVLFDFPNLSALTNYLVQSQSHTVQKPNPIKPVIKEHKGEVAIIGMSGRFPEAENLKEFWENLKSGRDSIQEIPANRWNGLDFFSENVSIEVQSNLSYSKYAGLMSDHDKFDPLFFNISPKEAELMDPQQRVFMQEAWRALEDAGVIKNVSGKKVGVFAGVVHNDYINLIKESMPIGSSQIFVGNNPAILASRISYLLNLKGPALTLDTACSSSLVAIHEAYTSILRGESDMALAGGVFIMATPQFHILASATQMLSVDGKCKTFDDSANGFVPGEGVGVVVLKELNQALTDGDRIYAVIKGSGINQDGKTNGIMAPNGLSQSELIDEVYKRAQIDPAEISFVETHGTGTKLGDPIEVTALNNVFNQYTTLKQFCSISSVKTNIGHTIATAGVAGFIKTVLALQNRQLVPSVNFNKPNEHIDFNNSPFYVQTELSDWSTNPGQKRLAAVSAFGISGTNAHMVLSEYENSNSYQTEIDKAYVFILSAKKEDRLIEMANNLLNYIKLHKDEASFSLANISYTLQMARVEMDERLALVANSTNSLMEKLNSFLAKGEGYYKGNLKRENKAFDLLLSGREGEAFAKIIVDDKNLAKLAQMWTFGLTVDWQILWREHRAELISLPNYPFERKRYWIENAKKIYSSVISKIHPLLHENISAINELKFCSEFDGTEFFLRDHLVERNSVLPGVAYLEMARVAGEKLLKRAINKICNITWLTPIVIKDRVAKRIFIELYPDHSSLVSFEIYSVDNSTKERTVHCQGKVGFGKEQSSQIINLNNILEKNRTSVLKKDAIYSLYKNNGLEYKDTFQCLQEVFIGTDECLAKIIVPKSIQASIKDFVLHPSLLDASLQGIIGLFNQQEAGTYLPFVLKELTLKNSVDLIEYAYIKRVSNTNNIQKFDLYLLDANGAVQVTLNDFTARAINQVKSTPMLTTEVNDSTLSVKLKNDLIQIVCDVVNVDKRDLDSNEDMSAYGFDSVLATKLISILNNKYGMSLTPATFFEYPTINAIADFIIHNYESEVVKMYGTVMVAPKASSSEIKIRDYNRSVKDIAVIGMSGTFPGSKDLNEYWKNLERGKDLIGDAPKERELNGYQGGFVADLDKFDAGFFNISPKEAELLDPQHRVFLETVWKALEDAGITKSKISGSRTAVYAGVSTVDYQGILIRNMQKGAYVPTGSSHSVLVNRISYLLNLTGPSEAIDTACSSSLVAIHRAVNSLMNGEADLAIAGGVNALLTADLFEAFTEAGMLSKDSRCKTFDETANGYVRGEGVGAVILKSLDSALADGDTIYAVIKATAVNHGGHVSSLTVPNPNAQADLIIEAINKAQIDPKTIGYIETHGTGTNLGDPVEINGLKKVFNHFAVEDKAICALGAVKANIGHLEAAAGIAGFIKVVLSLQHQKIPGLISLKKLNPYIDLKESPFTVSNKTIGWKKYDEVTPRRAGLSSFGFGGTNAHIILEEFLGSRDTVNNDQQAPIFILSAKKVDRLKEYAENLLAFITQNEFNVSALLYTLQTGREQMVERLAFVAYSADDIVVKLKSYLSGGNGFYTGNIKEEKTTDVLIAAKDFEKMAEQWTKGVVVDWKLLWSETPTPMRLPTYPFEKKRYWISENELVVSKIHPLLHTNSSILDQQKFTTKFLGSEFYLKDHKVGGVSVLPGVAYLEMARIAGEKSANRPVKKIVDIAWINPIAIQENKAKVIEISLYNEKNGQIAFEVSSESEIYCQGKLNFKTEQTFEKFQIDELLNQNQKSILSKEEIYTFYKERGLEYKESFQALEKVFVGTDTCLAQIKLPTILRKDQADYLLHPSLLDAALQGAIGVVDRNIEGTYLPFALKEVILNSEIKEVEYAYIKTSAINNGIQKLNLYLLDKLGNVQIIFKDFMTRELKLKKCDILYVKPEWRESALVKSINSGKQDFREIKALDELDLNNLTKKVVLNWTDLKGSLAELVEKCYFDFTKTVQNLMHLKVKDTLSLLVLAPNQPVFGAIAGLIKSIKQENPKYQIKLVLTDQRLSDEELSLELEKINDLEVRYKNNIRFVKTVNEFKPAKLTTKFKEHGTYLITGGLGGIGLIISKYLQQKYKAKIFLVGRSALNSHQKLDGASYLQVDVANFEQCQKLKTELPKIDGVIHAAGVIKDSYLVKKVLSEANQVINPKIFGTDNLVKLFSNEVDFILCCSSLSGLLGNAGQSDYSFANCYMDYVSEFEAKVFSVNWPLWKEGGMHVDQSIETYLKKSTGMDVLESVHALEILENALSLSNKQMLGITGDKEKILKYAQIAPSSIKSASLSNSAVQSKVERELVVLCSELLKVSEADLDINEELSEYGVDSIMMMSLLNRVEELYGNSVSASALAEYPTIKLFAEYLIRDEVVKIDEDKKNYSETKVILPEVNRSVRSIDNKFEVSKKIAVVSMACRFPKSQTLESFWSNLRSGIELISEVDDERWDVGKFFDANKASPLFKSYSKWAGLIEGIYDFDADYFDLSKKDALMMDPQQRILLEIAQELFDRAGYTKEQLSGKNSAVYIGGAESNYLKNNRDKIPNEYMNYLVVSNIQNMMAARISDFYNLKGEAFTIDTACSSSLVAIHQACQAILSGRVEMAIAGGIELLLDEQSHVGFSKAQVLSDEPHSYIFDKKAKGFLLGEGVGLVLLKDYDQAMKDNDQILGVVLGSAVNNDGKTVGLTVPSQEGQKEVIKRAIESANIDPSTITLYEAHGTGTLLGDPIEVKAASLVYQNYTDKKQYCAIGSVKSNIGHTLHAAGVASFIKTVLALTNREIPPSLNCKDPHPRFKFDESSFYPIQTREDWNPACGIRRAAISSFGFGGTNCHMILEEALNSKRVDFTLTEFESKYFNLGRNEKGLKQKFEEAYLEVKRSVETGRIDDEFAQMVLSKIKEKYDLNYT